MFSLSEIGTHVSNRTDRLKEPVWIHGGRVDTRMGTSVGTKQARYSDKH